MRVLVTLDQLLALCEHRTANRRFAISAKTWTEKATSGEHANADNVVVITECFDLLALLENATQRAVLLLPTLSYGLCWLGVMRVSCVCLSECEIAIRSRSEQQHSIGSLERLVDCPSVFRPYPHPGSSPTFSILCRGFCNQ